MGYPVDVIGIAEQKGSAQRYLRYNYYPRVPHMFADIASLRGTGGHCFVCNRKCKRSPKRPHLSTGGFPCPPFSAARQRSGSTRRTGGTQGHPQFNLVMNDLVEYLLRVAPFMFWLEEVAGFITALDALGGQSPAAALAERCRAAGYSVRAVLLDHRVWLRNSRLRVFIVGVHQDAGGDAAADEVIQLISSLSDAVSALGPPPGVFDIVDTRSLAEIRRRRTTADHTQQMYMCMCKR